MVKKLIKFSLLTIIISFSFANHVCSQGFFTLHYSKFDVDYKPKKIPDTAIFNNINKYNQRLILYITSDRGESHLELYNSKGILLQKGNYSNAIDTLSKYRFSKSLGFTDKKFHYSVSVIKFLEPLQSGSWYYFNEKQKLIRKDEYIFNRE